MIKWLSGKQGSIFFSSIGGEILPAAKLADRGSMLAEIIKKLLVPDTDLPFVLTVESNGLY